MSIRKEVSGLQSKVSGAVIAPVVLVLVGIAVGVGGTLCVQYLLKGDGTQLGDGDLISIEDSVNTSIITETDLTSETPAPTLPTEPSTKPFLFETSTLQVVEITVSGNEYLCNGESYSIERILGAISVNDEEQTISIIDRNASLKAYNTLIKALDAEGIHYTADNT